MAEKELDIKKELKELKRLTSEAKELLDDYVLLENVKKTLRIYYYCLSIKKND